MTQESAFTSAAMASALENSSVSYEDLAEIEKQFDDAETEIIRQQVALTAPLYKKRAELLSKIDNFWPLVLEQAPPDIDQYIQPSDSALLLSSLTSLSVRNFELTDGVKGGDPRSIAIKFEFADNEYFENKVLEKKFWYRRARDGWCGLVSEPVKIDWKKGKDLTDGLLPLVIKAWEAEQKAAGGKPGPSPEQKALMKKIEGTGMGGLSIFSWFGFVGRRVTAEVSEAANKREAAMRKGKKVEDVEPLTEEEEDKEDMEMSLEIFPDGDDLAIAIAEDLWPGAIKYFIQAQEQDALSDGDFESDDDDGVESFQGLSDIDNEEPAPKKRKN